MDTVSDLLLALRLPSQDVSHIYLTGSRLWGTNTNHSDYDLFLVLLDTPKDAKILKSQHMKQYDFTIMTESAFAARVQEGSLIETICCLLGNKERCVWRQTKPLNELVTDSEKISTWVADRHSIDHSKALKFWTKGKKTEAFKILQYMLIANRLVDLLKVREEESSGQLRYAKIRVDDIQSVVRGALNENDWHWLGLTWDKVVALHTLRLENR